MHHIVQEEWCKMVLENVCERWWMKVCKDVTENVLLITVWWRNVLLKLPGNVFGET